MQTKMAGTSNAAATLPVGAAAIVAKQQAHPRHAPILAASTGLPKSVLEESLVSCFEQQVALHPQHIAVASATGTLTYTALNVAANRLAHHLIALGIPTNAPITILLDRSLETLISMVGILKVGGYYLCLEPTLPLARAEEILNLAATQSVITTSAFASYAMQLLPPGGTLIILDEITADELTHNSTHNLAYNPNIAIPATQPSRLGFTSGSTGKPKPILKNHATYLYGAWQSSNAYLLSPADRHAMVYQFSAGPSTRPTVSALLTGGSVHLHPALNYDMSSWAGWIEREAITQLYMPTAAFRELLHTRPDGLNFPSVRMVYVAGQTIYRQDAELFQRRFCQGTILVSRFSMSETSGLAHYLVDHDTTFDAETLPIGYALPGRDLLIVDDNGQPLGFDQPGEIAVRGISPYGEDAPVTVVDRNSIFRTADLGMMRADGCLMHLGRKDDMIKVRGNRVALAEAENLLMKVEGVAQAAIKPFPTASGDNRLIGYVTAKADVRLTPAGVRATLELIAPAYMVPARVVVLPAMPITTSGKVDRQALPLPDAARPPLATPHVAPRNEVEAQIATIWAELLEVDEVGVDDNFFALGGDSISAMRMALRVESITGTTLPQDYFQAPTIAALTVASPPATTDALAREHSGRVSGRGPKRAMGSRFERLIKGQLTPTSLLRALIYRRLMQLTYPEGIRWLAWLGQPALASRLFPHERAWLHTLVAELDSPAHATDSATDSATNSATEHVTNNVTDNAFGISVLGNLIRNSFQRSWLYRRPAHGDLMAAMHKAPERFWRTFAQQVELGSQQAGTSRFDFRGLEHLVHAQKRQRGTILLTYHSTASALANVILSRQTHLGRIPTISLVRADQVAGELWDEEDGVDDDRREQASAGWAAAYALQAQRILLQGGVVRIVNDVTYDAANSLTKTVGRRQYNLKPGFAELAMTTGATVLPIRSNFDARGCIHLNILPALTTQADPGDATIDAANDTALYVNDLLDQYAAFLTTTWRTAPESLGWGSLRRYNQRPLASTGAGQG